MLQVTPRPLGFGELLDGAFTLLRRHFAFLFGLALVPQVPEILYWLGVTALLPLELQGVASFLILPWSFAVTAFLAGALVWAVVRLLEPDPDPAASPAPEPTIRDGLRAGLRHWLSVAFALFLLGFLFSVVFGMGIFGATIAFAAGGLALGPVGFVLVGVVAGFGLLAVLGFLFASFFGFVPAAVVEDAGPLRALGRSWDLSAGARLRILGISAIAWLLVLIPGLVATTVAFSVVGFEELLTGDPEAMSDRSLWANGLVQILSPVINAVTYPFFIAVLTLLYLDRRARTEAPDLARAVDALGTTPSAP